jgi:hypothetical protein
MYLLSPGSQLVRASTKEEEKIVASATLFFANRLDCH